MCTLGLDLVSVPSQTNEPVAIMIWNKNYTRQISNGPSDGEHKALQSYFCSHKRVGIDYIVASLEQISTCSMD